MCHRENEKDEKFIFSIFWLNLNCLKETHFLFASEILRLNVKHSAFDQMKYKQPPRNWWYKFHASSNDIPNRLQTFESFEQRKLMWIKHVRIPAKIAQMFMFSREAERVQRMKFLPLVLHCITEIRSKNNRRRKSIFGFGRWCQKKPGESNEQTTKHNFVSFN